MNEIIEQISSRHDLKVSVFDLSKLYASISEGIIVPVDIEFLEPEGVVDEIK